MGRALKRRLDRLQALEEKATPPKIVIWWPDEPRPVVDENTVIIKVIYEDRDPWHALR